MALKTLVIVNGISNLSDARYCAGMGVDMLGFDLETSSPAYIEPQTFKIINEWVAGVKKVGELPKAEAEDLEKLLASYHLDYLQTDYSSNWQRLRSVGIPLICRVNWVEEWTAADFKQNYELAIPYLDFILVKISRITEKVSRALSQIASEYPVLLGTDLTSIEVEKLLSEIPVKGLALKGSQEIRPGLKDFDQLAQILEQLEVED